MQFLATNDPSFDTTTHWFLLPNDSFAQALNVDGLPSNQYVSLVTESVVFWRLIQNENTLLAPAYDLLVKHINNGTLTEHYANVKHNVSESLYDLVYDSLTVVERVTQGRKWVKLFLCSTRAVWSMPSVHSQPVLCCIFRFSTCVLCPAAKVVSISYSNSSSLMSFSQQHNRT